jgi:hypothetical protein
VSQRTGAAIGPDPNLVSLNQSGFEKNLTKAPSTTEDIVASRWRMARDESSGIACPSEIFGDARDVAERFRARAHGGEDILIRKGARPSFHRTKVAVCCRIKVGATQTAFPRLSEPAAH